MVIRYFQFDRFLFLLKNEFDFNLEMNKGFLQSKKNKN